MIELKAAIDGLKSSFPDDFILIGGGSMIAYGSERITKDLDILVQPNTTGKLTNPAKVGGVLGRINKGFAVRGAPLDVLTEAVQLFTIEALGVFFQ
jgi:hypothetical protein